MDDNARTPTLKLHDAGASDAPSTPVGDTPSQQLVKQALQAETLDYVKDDGAPGTISVRKPSPLAQFRIVEAAGPEMSQNGAWMQMVNPLIYIGALDGQPEAMPASKLEIEALIVRLGENGMDRLLLWYMTKIMGPMHDAAAAAQKAEADKLTLKN